MAGVLDGVNSRTRLAGHNRLEMLMFRLNGRQRFGINVFKVQEVIQCPPLTQLPHSHSAIRGVTSLRGKTISLVDLGMAIGRPPLRDLDRATVIVAEYNRTVQGFLVGSVDHIVNLTWEEIMPPPKGAGKHYITAVTRIDEELVEIIDVEKVLTELIGVDTTVSPQLVSEGRETVDSIVHRALLVDDSSVALQQAQHTLEQLGVECIQARDGREGLALLKAWADEGIDVTNRLSLVLSDVEMPQMDGYTLTAEIRRDPRLQGLFVILHSSLSGGFNKALTDRVGADEFIPKFNPNELAKTVLRRLHALASPTRASANG